MQSKLLVNVTEECVPCITVVQPFTKPDERTDLPDKVLQMIFEGLELKSKFLKVESEYFQDNSHVRTITALNLKEAVNELERLISPEIQTPELAEAFRVVRESII